MSTYEPETSGHEPGLELHEWETQWQQLRDLAEDDPAQALPELADFVEALMRQRGFRPDLEPDVSGQPREIVGGYRFAREIADGVERGDDVGPGDVGAAHGALEEVYRLLTDELTGRA